MLFTKLPIGNAVGTFLARPGTIADGEHTSVVGTMTIKILILTALIGVIAGFSHAGQAQPLPRRKD